MDTTTITVAEHWEPMSGGYRQSFTMHDGVPVAVTYAYGDGGQWYEESTPVRMTPNGGTDAALPAWCEQDEADYQLAEWQVEGSGMTVLQVEDDVAVRTPEGWALYKVTRS